MESAEEDALLSAFTVTSKCLPDLAGSGFSVALVGVNTPSPGGQGEAKSVWASLRQPRTAALPIDCANSRSEQQQQGKARHGSKRAMLSSCVDCRPPTRRSIDRARAQAFLRYLIAI